VKTDNGESTSVWMPTPGTRAEPQLDGTRLSPGGGKKRAQI